MNIGKTILNMQIYHDYENIMNMQKYHEYAKIIKISWMYKNIINMFKKYSMQLKILWFVTINQKNIEKINWFN